MVRVCTSPPSAVLEELEPNPAGMTTPHLTWPDFPEIEKDTPHGPLRLMGLEPNASLVLRDDERTAAELFEMLRDAWVRGWADDLLPEVSTGYLTVIASRFCLYDPLSDNYLLLVTSSKSSRPEYARQQRIMEKFQPDYFVDPHGQTPEPVKRQSLPRPYPFDTCWVGKSGQVLFDVRAFCQFLKKHEGAIADPYAWEDKVTDPHYQPYRSSVIEGRRARVLTLGEDT